MSEVKRQTEVYTYAAVLQEGLRHRRKGRVGPTELEIIFNSNALG